MLDVAIGSDASLFALDGGHRLWTHIAPGDWARIGAANRYHVCGVTLGNGSDNSVWTDTDVMVGTDHYLRRYFRAAGGERSDGGWGLSDIAGCVWGAG